MENTQDKSYRKEQPVHKVNIFHLMSSYRFFHLSCEDCKLQHKCYDINHKREICKVSKNTEQLLLDFTHGRIASFVSDDFYILLPNNNQQELKEILKFLRMKYMKKNAR